MATILYIFLVACNIQCMACDQEPPAPTNQYSSELEKHQLRNQAYILEDTKTLLTMMEDQESKISRLTGQQQRESFDMIKELIANQSMVMKQEIAKNDITMNSLYLHSIQVKNGIIYTSHLINCELAYFQ